MKNNLRTCLLCALMLLSAPCWADIYDDHYKGALAEIAKRLEAQGLKVHSVQLKDKRGKDVQGKAMLAAMVVIEVEGVRRSYSVPMTIFSNDTMFETKGWVETFMNKWVQNMMNHALFIPSGYFSVNLLVENIRIETNNEITRLEQLKRAMAKGLVPKGSYLNERIVATEVLLRRQLSMLEAISYKNHNGEVVNKLLMVPDIFPITESYARERLGLAVEVIAHFDHELEKLELLKELGSKTIGGSAELTVKVAELSGERARFIKLKHTLHALIGLHTRASADNHELGAEFTEEGLLTKQIELLMELKQALKMVEILDNLKGKTQNPFSKEAESYRKAILVCQGYFNRLASLGLDFKNRSLTVELGAEMMELNERIKAMQAIEFLQRNPGQLDQLSKETELIEAKVAYNRFTWELEFQRLRELNSRGLLNGPEKNKLQYYEFELKAIQEQIAEAARLKTLGRYLRVR